MANINYNKIIIGGRLTADPELRQTSSGNAVANFTLAVSRRVRSETDFFKVKAFNGLSETAVKFFRKGSSVIVTGRAQNSVYTDGEGVTHRVTEVVAEDLSFVDSKAEAAALAQPAPESASLPDEDIPF